MLNSAIRILTLYRSVKTKNHNMHILQANGKFLLHTTLFILKYAILMTFTTCLGYHCPKVITIMSTPSAFPFWILHLYLHFLSAYFFKDHHEFCFLSIHFQSMFIINFIVLIEYILKAI